jgi:hypothetical protein
MPAKRHMPLNRTAYSARRGGDYKQKIKLYKYE